MKVYQADSEIGLEYPEIGLEYPEIGLEYPEQTQYLKYYVLSEYVGLDRLGT